MDRAAWSETDTVMTMHGHSTRLRYFGRGLVFVWTSIVSLLLCNQIFRQNEQVLEVARLQARSLLQRDLVYRQWVALNSGVYLPVSAEIQPNPHLSQVPARDIVSSDGKLYTMVNPAYMSRLVYKLAEKREGSRSHITSLNPLMPENAPDQWEAEALRAFARGAKEHSSVVRINGHDYFRLMTPLLTERECLDCHAKQGIHEGGVSGGISVTILLEPLQTISDREKYDSMVGFGMLWLVGMLGLSAGTASVRRSLAGHEQAGRKLHYMSTHDGLTDCYNRIYFDTELDRLTKGRAFPVGVVMVDLDGLKEVNDRLGHGAGDQLIKQGATVLKQACREADVVARIGGDEFALLLPGMDSAALDEMVLRIRSCQELSNQLHGGPKLGLSLGAVCAESPEKLQGALKKADLRMYDEKQSKKLKSMFCV
jgi:diguanylate cyclase (GGDEF)-like protein